MERSMFETLLELPLFQGLGKDDLTQIIETVKFNFTTFEQNQIIARQDEVCNHLLFLLKGNLTVSTRSDDHQFTLTERIQAPGVLQAEALYGIYPRFTHTYTAQSDTCILSVEKQAVNHIFMSYEVFRINIMNLLSTQIFKNQRLLWRSPAERPGRGCLRRRGPSARGRAPPPPAPCWRGPWPPPRYSSRAGRNPR